LTDAASSSPPPADAAADLALARAAGAGDEASRRALARRLLERTRATVRYLVGDSPDAPDWVQLGLLEVLRSAHTFRGESRLETWADRIVVRTALRQIKQARKRPESPSAEIGQDNGVEPEAGASPGAPGSGLEPTHPGEALERQRVRRCLAALLQRLGPERRAVLVLHVVLGHSVPEIAAMTDTPEHTVWDRLKVGKRKLRRLILADDTLREWAGKGEP
jgi:RNA polymerase sigma-70 factor (ECF subfamily)